MKNVMKNAALSESIAKMYLNERLADVHFEFKVDGEVKTVPANKSVLAALSPVFDTMFFGSLKEGREVRIEDANADAFKEFLQFFYLGEVTLSMENFESVVRLADKYDVLEKFNACAVLMQNQLTLDNMCSGYQLAVYLKNEQLIDFCADEISKSPKDVFSSDAFKRCNKNILERILELDLKCKEVDVFDACLTWAKYACEEDGLDATQSVNLRTQLGDCLKSIRFGKMTIDEFSKRYILHKALFTLEEFEDIMLTLSGTEYEPKIFNPNSRCKNLMELVWIPPTVLQCHRKTKAYPKKYIKNVETTSFSSNKKLLLTYIRTAKTNGSSRIVTTKVRVIVTERESLSFNLKPKTVYESTFNIWRCNYLGMRFPQPILIQPHRLYEISLGLPSTDGCYYYSNSEHMVEMTGDTRIQFHQNPTLNYNNIENSWLSTFHFEKSSE